jgi:hypothetical protein
MRPEEWSAGEQGKALVHGIKEWTSSFHKEGAKWNGKSCLARRFNSAKCESLDHPG